MYEVKEMSQETLNRLEAFAVTIKTTLNDPELAKSIREWTDADDGATFALIQAALRRHRANVSRAMSDDAPRHAPYANTSFKEKRKVFRLITSIQFQIFMIWKTHHYL